ncbi:MAG: hypothetical protein CVV21_09825 [Candidatus Goldiibacteriota bacterium HGW-Goldbacteria-1]|jgi:hypothetical protein|nr:MAG: hypothetical protein CVV21_09825 [Candidatus Goldiibacteriota bacterium HGW-Goldbacteria-1]
MAGCSIINHKGKKIVHMDFSNSNQEEVMSTMKQAEALIRNQPPESVLGLLDISGSMYNKEIAAAFKDFAAGNKPFIKMTAVVGLEGIKKVLYDAVLMFTRRKNLVAMDSLEKAKDFLAELK